MVESIKENNGRASQDRLAKRIFLCISGTFLLLVCISIFRNMNSDDRHVNKYLKYDPRFGGHLGRRPRFRGRGGGGGMGGARHGMVDTHTNVQFEAMYARQQAEAERRILAAEVHLVDVKIPPMALAAGQGYYRGVRAEFCQLDWGKHKDDPSKVPMFRDLTVASPDCQRTRIEIDLAYILSKAKETDEAAAQAFTAKQHQQNPNHHEHPTPRSLPVGGFVFHESRCGSTLVSNALAVADPVGHRVFSESPPPIGAIKACEKHSFGAAGLSNRGNQEDLCDPTLHKQLFQDVIYLMGRTNNPLEQRQFFKIQSIGSTSISTFRQFMPEVPWVFVYRDPVQVMMSHVGQKGVPLNRANCVRTKKMPTQEYEDLIIERGGYSSQLSLEEHCAAHLAYICEGARKEQENSHTGMMINYEKLPNILLDTVFPHHFHIQVYKAVRDRVTAVSGKYSKGRFGERDWVEDSEKKDLEASIEVRKAAKQFLAPTYEWLEEEAKRYDPNAAQFHHGFAHHGAGGGGVAKRVR